MGIYEKDQKILAMIMTNNKPSKTLLCITNAEIRLNGSIINWLEIHTHTYIYMLYLNRKIDCSEMPWTSYGVVMRQILLEPEKWQQKMQR